MQYAWSKVVIEDREFIVKFDALQLAVRDPGDLITAEITEVIPEQRVPQHDPSKVE